MRGVSARALWTSAEIAAATGGVASDDFAACGVTFDSREVAAGDLFIAMKGEAADGHRFLPQAFERGAAGAIVSEDVARPHVRVADMMAALNALGAAARARTGAKIIGVTGSVGKTGTKEALHAALDRPDPGCAHRSVKSYNNHTGVPLSLARMPADAGYGVFEMGMNHAGELAQLTRLVRPHAAIITAIAPAHIEFFRDEAAIAEAKAEIFEGLEPGGTAIIPFDSPHRDRLLAAARPHAGRIVTFGTDKAADFHAVETMRTDAGGTFVNARMPGRALSFTVAHPGAHWVSNALAVLAAVDAVGGDLGMAGLAMGELAGIAGRGRRSTIDVAGGKALLIDESYNANPSSMRATLSMLAAEAAARKIAVLGEMRELGVDGAVFHAGLAEPLIASGAARAVLVGPQMAPLADALEGRIDFVHVADVAAAREIVGAIVAPGDAVLVKGSNGVGLASLVAQLMAGNG